MSLKMKYSIILILLLLAACTPAAKDKVSLQDTFVALQENPDEAVSECDNLVTEDGRQACYGTYLTIKAERQESIDPAICDKLIDPEIKEGCELYVVLQESGRIGGSN